MMMQLSAKSERSKSVSDTEDFGQSIQKVKKDAYFNQVMSKTDKRLKRTLI